MFLFLRRLRPPPEAEQVAAYREVFRHSGPTRPVTVRLLDVGGDKELPYLELPGEPNPFLGVRGIRLARADRSLFVSQVRAVLTAARVERVDARLMAPMVATVADVELVDDVVREGNEAGPADASRREVVLSVGIMVEVPSAAILARALTDRVAFTTIGTNDLTQYTLAADRTSAQLASLQDPLHPAVLALVASTVRAAHEAGIPVAVCGEVAADPAAAAVLVRLGVDELSMAPASLGAVDAMLAGATRERLEAPAAPDAATNRRLARTAIGEGSPA
jgi:phosphocarrier protein FPr